MIDDLPEIECPECEGLGFFPPLVRMGETTECEHCAGTGWRQMTDEEHADACADAYSDMCESEPPMSAAERAAMQAERDDRWLK